jgi:pyruvate-formate lyase-activating enzyme
MSLYTKLRTFVPNEALHGARHVLDVLQGNRFYCAALNGESDYNLSVNSDMTVSCNCQDVDGSGRLGDLSKETLPEILRGPTAQRFRNDLADGRPPISTCRHCPELRRVGAEEAKRRAVEFVMPNKWLMVENTSACNHACIGCDRNAIARTWKKRQMSLDDMERVAMQVQALGIKKVAFFKLGEPFLSRNVKQEIMILRKHNPGLIITTSTNGAMLDTDEKREAAMMLDYVGFSIDGPDQETLVRYQVGGDYERAVRNMRALVELRRARGLTAPVITWKYIVFRWNDRRQQVDRAIQRAREVGADFITFWPTGNPRWGQSIRYQLGGYVATVGGERGGHRVLDLRPPGRLA